MVATETASPDVGVEQQEKQKVGESLLRPWSVILHNDDHNEMIYVVRSLIKCVPNLGARQTFNDAPCMFLVGCRRAICDEIGEQETSSIRHGVPRL